MASKFHDLITIVIDDCGISFASIVSRSHNRPLLNALSTHTWNNSAIERTIVYNSTYIVTLLKKFIHTHSITDTAVSIAVRGKGLHDQFIQTKSIVFDATMHALNDQIWQWDYRYLYAHDHTHFVFYLFGIAHYTILQYKMLATYAHIDLVNITTHRMALLQLYQYVHKDTYRSAQLAQDMHAHNSMLECYFTTATIAHLMDHAPQVMLFDHDFLTLLVHYGQYFSTRNNHGRY